jgi:hypothetical protein
LLEKAHLEIPTLQNSNSKLELVKFQAPKTVPTQCSHLKASNGDSIVTASGGVEITSWQVADRVVESPEAAKVRASAAGKGGSLWWN